MWFFSDILFTLYMLKYSTKERKRKPSCLCGFGEEMLPWGRTLSRWPVVVGRFEELLISLCLGFLICQMGTGWLHTPRGAAVDIEWRWSHPQVITQEGGALQPSGGVRGTQVGVQIQAQDFKTSFSQRERPLGSSMVVPLGHFFLRTGLGAPGSSNVH